MLKKIEYGENSKDSFAFAWIRRFLGIVGKKIKRSFAYYCTIQEVKIDVCMNRKNFSVQEFLN